MARAYTYEFAPGFHDDTRPSARTWASRCRGYPRTRVKSPPRYQPPAPSGATANTLPSLKDESVAAAVAGSRRTDVPVYGPTVSKLPPRYTRPGPASMALTGPLGTQNPSMGVADCAQAPGATGASSSDPTSSEARRPALKARSMTAPFRPSSPRESAGAPDGQPP